MKKYYIHTFGCQMNVHDSEKMAGVLHGRGLSETDSQDDADIIIFNTCSIRQKAEQKFLSELGRMKAVKKRRPEVKIAVAGCIAKQMGGELMKRTPHVDYVLGPQNIHALDEMIGLESAISIGENPDIAINDLPVLRKEKGRAWVTIMYGCNNFCTYCIVPYTRGREVSRPSGNIVNEIRGLVDEGCLEVTLLGQNVNSYRSDKDFPGLLREVNKIDGLKRIRFVTSHPRDLTEGLMDCIGGLEKVCEHIHLPLQSGSSRVLDLMNRGYTYEEYRDRVLMLREKVPGIAITTDIIAGFPSETGEDHCATVRAISEIRFDGMFAFKHSPRPGTVASAMEGQLEEEFKLTRLKELLELQDDITLNINNKLEGSRQEVLVEGQSETDPSRLTGRTRTNKVVNFDCAEGTERGRLAGVLIQRARKHSLEGALVAPGPEGIKS